MLDMDWRLVSRCDEYAVSRDGEIKRVKAATSNRYLGRILKASLSSGGYPSVTLAIDRRHQTFPVYQIVAEAFHGPRPHASYQVAHNDGNKLNSTAENLRWATAKDNIADKNLHGTMPRGDRHHCRLRPDRVARGERVGTCKLSEDDVLEIRRLPITQMDAARIFGISQTQVSDIRTRKSWKHLEERAA